MEELSELSIECSPLHSTTQDKCFTESLSMLTKLRDLTEDLSQLDRQALRLVTSAKTVNKDLEILNKELQEERYLDNLIETLISNGDSMKYVFYPVDINQLREASKSQMHIQSPVEQGVNPEQPELNEEEDHMSVKKSSSDTTLVVNV